MSYTLGTAAKAVGKSKATISKAIKSGRISATKHDNGSYTIDAAELRSDQHRQRYSSHANT
jgi:predicted site-specific integrase-resolvase